MSDRNIDIKIRSSSNSAEIDKTNKSLDNLDKKQTKANKTANESKKAGINASAGFGAAGAAAGAAASGGISSISSAMGQMLQQMEGVAAFAGTGGLLLGAFAAWKAAIDALIQGHENLEKNLQSIQSGNRSAEVDRLVNSYKDLTEQLSDAAAEVDRFFNAQSAGGDAIKRAELAKLAVDEAEAKSRLDPNDKYGARRLDLDIARRRAAIEDQAARRRMVEEERAIGQKIDITGSQLSGARNQEAVLEQQAQKLTSDLARIITRTNEKASTWWRTSAGEEAVYKAAQPIIDAIKADLEKTRSELKAAQGNANTARAALANLSSARDINRLNQSTYGNEQAAAQQGFSNTAAGIRYDQRSEINSARIEAERKRDEINRKGSELQSAYQKERYDVSRAKDKGASDAELKKELEEAKKALEATRKYSRENAAVLRELNSEINKAREAIRNLPRN